MFFSINSSYKKEKLSSEVILLDDPIQKIHDHLWSQMGHTYQIISRFCRQSPITLEISLWGSVLELRRRCNHLWDPPNNDKQGSDPLSDWSRTTEAIRLLDVEMLWYHDNSKSERLLYLNHSSIRLHNLFPLIGEIKSSILSNYNHPYLFVISCDIHVIYLKM